MSSGVKSDCGSKLGSSSSKTMRNRRELNMMKDTEAEAKSGKHVRRYKKSTLNKY